MSITLTLHIIVVLLSLIQSSTSNQLVDSIFKYEGPEYIAKFEKIFCKANFHILIEKCKTQNIVHSLDRTIVQLEIDFATVTPRESMGIAGCMG